ncbi:MAG TPA: NTP transferase domain-containing protein [Methanobacterium sp.]|nr:NTP transferase domain-containing protein [Methanobacterium sp.]
MISAIITAAGKNRRMEEDQRRLGLKIQHKLLLDLHGKPVIIRTLNNVLNTHINRCIIVLGHYSDEIQTILKKVIPGNVKIISNIDKDVQLSETLLNGVRNIEEGGLCLCVAADQPTVTTRSMDRLIYEAQKHQDNENIVSILARRDTGFLNSTLGLGMPFVCHSTLLMKYLPHRNDNLNPILGDMFDDGVEFYGVPPVHSRELTNINYWDDYLTVVNYMNNQL